MKYSLSLPLQIENKLVLHYPDKRSWRGINIERVRRAVSNGDIFKIKGMGNGVVKEICNWLAEQTEEIDPEDLYFQSLKGKLEKQGTTQHHIHDHISYPEGVNYDELINFLSEKAATIAKYHVQWEDEWDEQLIRNLSVDARVYAATRIYAFHNVLMRTEEAKAINIDEFESWEGLGAPPTKPPLRTTVTVLNGNGLIEKPIDVKILVHDVSLRVNNINPIYSPGQTSPVPTWEIANEPKALYFIIKTKQQTLEELMVEIMNIRRNTPGAFYVVSKIKSANVLTKEGIGLLRLPEMDLFRSRSMH